MTTCTVHACLRPVRAPGDYCLYHWLGLSPMQRAAVQGEVKQPTVEINSEQVRIACELENLWDAPAYGEAA